MHRYRLCVSHLEWLAYLSIIFNTHSPNFSVPAVKPMSLQKALALSAFDGVELVLEVDDCDVDWLLASETPQLKPRRLASLTYDFHVRVISHSREPLRVKVAFWQMKSSSHTTTFPPKQPFAAVDGVEDDVCAAKTSSGFMSHLYLADPGIEGLFINNFFEVSNV